MKTGGKEVFGEINITPLTDIFLVLLIIMMVVAPLINYKGLDVKFSSGGASTPSAEKVKVIQVSIGAEGSFVVDGEEVPSTQLVQTFKTKAPDYPDGISIEVSPDAALDYMTIALDAAGAAGISKVDIEAKKDGGSESTPPDKPAKKK